MKDLNQLKKTVCKIGLIFIGGMIILTMLSKTIYTLLLPTVEIDRVTNGAIKTDFYTKGKIGYDSLLINQMKIPIKTSQEGQVTKCYVKENDKVKVGDELIVIQNEVNPEKQIEAMSQRREIEINIEAYEREKDNFSKQCQMKKEELAYQEKLLQDFSDDYEVIELEEQINQKKQEAASNEALFEAGAIPERERDKSNNDLDLLQKKQELLKYEHDKKINESIKELQQKIDDFNNSILEQEEKIEIEKNKLLTLEEKQAVKVLRSPIDGIIYELKIGEGITATQGEELMVIIPDKIPITLAFALEQETADKLEIDSKVVWTKAQKDKTAKVLKKTYDQEKENTIITCELGQELVADWVTDYKTYKSVDVRVSTQSERYQCTVPTSAINFEGQNAFVYVLKEEDTVFEKKYTVLKHQVSVIYEGDEKSAIEGLSQETPIVVMTNKVLKDKMEVRLKSAE